MSSREAGNTVREMRELFVCNTVLIQEVRDTDRCRGGSIASSFATSGGGWGSTLQERRT